MEPGVFSRRKYSMSTRVSFAVVSLVSGLLSVAGCGTNSPTHGGGGSGGPRGGGGSNPPPKIPGGIGWGVVRAACPPAMGPTTVTGTVPIPAGTLPLYNAKVYIPTGDTIPAPPASGASCDRC